MTCRCMWEVLEEVCWMISPRANKSMRTRLQLQFDGFIISSMYVCIFRMQKVFHWSWVCVVLGACPLEITMPKNFRAPIKKEEEFLSYCLAQKRISNLIPLVKPDTWYVTPQACITGAKLIPEPQFAIAHACLTLETGRQVNRIW